MVTFKQYFERGGEGWCVLNRDLEQVTYIKWTRKGFYYDVWSEGSKDNGYIYVV